MFCDLVGSTALSARLDPEDMREIIGAYHRCCADLITRAGGFVAKYMGDGVLVYFGYPQAHEHDAERAVRAGLALVEAVPKLKTAAGAPLQVRVGIATGLVVVGDLIGAGCGPGAGGGRRDAEPRRAAASAGRAGHGGDRIEHTQADRRPVRLPRSRDSRAQGLRRDRPGMAGAGRERRREPVRGAAHERRRRSSGATRRSICSCAAGSRRRAARAAVVLLSGEPGIGKSRIAETILERLSGEPHTRLRYFCSPHHQDSALYPSITQLERAAGFRREDTDEQRLTKLEAVLAQAANDLGEAVPLLADLLSIPTGDRYPRARPHPAEAQGEDTSGAGGAGRGAGGASTGADGGRGRALERSHHARAVRPDRRAGVDACRSWRSSPSGRSSRHPGSAVRR